MSLMPEAHAGSEYARLGTIVNTGPRDPARVGELEQNARRPCLKSFTVQEPQEHSGDERGCLQDDGAHYHLRAT